MTSWTIDERFLTRANADVVGFLRRSRPSAHSDVAEELRRAGAALPGLRSYCPDPARYAFVALHLEDFRIVRVAFGSSGLAYRLPAERVPEAYEDGDVLASELGRTWVRFEPWPVGETLARSRERLARWCAVAAATGPD